MMWYSISRSRVTFVIDTGSNSSKTNKNLAEGPNCLGRDCRLHLVSKTVHSDHHAFRGRSTSFPLPYTVGPSQSRNKSYYEHASRGSIRYFPHVCPACPVRPVITSDQEQGRTNITLAITPGFYPGNVRSFLLHGSRYGKVYQCVSTKISHFLVHLQPSIHRKTGGVSYVALDTPGLKNY